MHDVSGCSGGRAMGNSMREGKAVSDMRLAFVLAKSEKLTSLEVLEVPCV